MFVSSLNGLRFCLIFHISFYPTPFVPRKPRNPCLRLRDVEWLLPLPCLDVVTFRCRHINEGLRDLLRLEKDEEQKNAVTLLDFVVQSDVNHLQSFERDLLLQAKGASGMSVSFRLSGQRADSGNQAEAKRNSKSKMSMRDDAEEEKPEASPSGSCDSGNEDKPTLSMSVVWTSRLAALNAENNFYRSLLLVGTRPAGAEGWPQMLKYSP
eukprot:753474-Hanusia_phi.AAC.7